MLFRVVLQEVADDEDEHWGGGSVSPSAYEAAWVALVREPEQPDQLAFPDSLAWLLTSQRVDGSWDAPFPYSIIPTMAALLALRRSPDQSISVQSAAERALQYLRRTLPRWNAQLVDTPFFEFIIPLLAGELDRLGIALLIPDLALMQERRAVKLARLPPDMLYSGESNLLHALEVFGASLDFTCIHPLRAANGSYGCSPSATAAVLLHSPAWDAAAAAWLRRESGSGGALPTSHPSDVFEAAWVLHLLHHGGVHLNPATSPAVRQLLGWLYASLTPQGAGFARVGTLPCDADDTAMVLAVLNRLGVHSPLDALWRFERPDHFVSYDGERTSSASANAHVLEAMLSVDAIGLPALATRRDKVVRYLLAERTTEGFWLDKWHLSPYYATLSCVLALSHLPDLAMRRELASTLAWLERTQRRGGGWGWYEATVEETAYGLLTVMELLRVLPERQTPANRGLLRRAYRYLVRRLPKPGQPSASLPTLWVDKTLYVPPRVIQAAILAALHKYASRHLSVTDIS
jgi:halimadienyl-diphosphate synthase